MLILRAAALARHHWKSCIFKYATRIEGENREVDETDVLVIGGGPAGLATAIRLKQLSLEQSRDVRVVILEKAAEIGSHSVSGAVLDPKALNELLPDWKSMNSPIDQNPVTKNQVQFLTSKFSIPLPVPPTFFNSGNYIISLSDACKWLAGVAESLGVEIYPSIAGSKLWLEDNELKGIVTNDVGIDKGGQKKASFQPGMAMRSKITVLAEGSHGSLTKMAINHFNLRDKGQFQTYALGLKEIWKVPSAKHEAGKVIHSIGYPLGNDVYGGGFIYHYGDNLVSLGLVVGLNYCNPTLSPYHEFQQYKRHPSVSDMLQGGSCIQYAARTLAQGGIQSLPKLYFPGGVLVGCSAGFLNSAKIKGNHTAMKSGMIAAESIFEKLNSGSEGSEAMSLDNYEANIKKSWLWKELYATRNEKPAFKWGMAVGSLHAAFDSIFGAYVPWTISHKAPDHTLLKPLESVTRKVYPKPDNVTTFSLLDNLSRTGTNHEEDQPCHLRLKDSAIPTNVNLAVYGGPESYYCPAGVYEFVSTESNSNESSATSNSNASSMRLQINAPNCIHCKTCDIKDPMQNINWVPPEGGGGPQYSGT